MKEVCVLSTVVNGNEFAQSIPTGLTFFSVKMWGKGRARGSGTEHLSSARETLGSLPAIRKTGGAGGCSELSPL